MKVPSRAAESKPRIEHCMWHLPASPLWHHGTLDQQENVILSAPAKYLLLLFVTNSDAFTGNLTRAKTRDQRGRAHAKREEEAAPDVAPRGQGMTLCTRGYMYTFSTVSVSEVGNVTTGKTCALWIRHCPEATEGVWVWGPALRDESGGRTWLWGSPRLCSSFRYKPTTRSSWARFRGALTSGDEHVVKSGQCSVPRWKERSDLSARHCRRRRGSFRGQGMDRNQAHKANVGLLAHTLTLPVIITHSLVSLELQWR